MGATVALVIRRARRVLAPQRLIACPAAVRSCCSTTSVSPAAMTDITWRQVVAQNAFTLALNACPA